MNFILTSFIFAKSNIPVLTEEIYYQQVQFLIAKSTKDYNEAKREAINLSKKLNITLNLRDLQFNKKSFLSFDRKICEDNLYDYPCYMPRGRYDDGEYISIEHTNSYKDFKDGYYMIVVASGIDLDNILKKVKKSVKDVYIKSTNIYMGSIR